MTRKQLARYLVEVTKEIFDMMIPIPIQIGKPAPQGGKKVSDGVNAIIGMAGDFPVLIRTRCTPSAALEIASILLDETISEINEDTEDAIGELANMLAGGIKGKLAESGANLQLTIPSVVSGEGYSIKQPADVVGVRVPFELGGDKRLEVTLIVKSKLVE